MNFILTGDWHFSIKPSIPREWAIRRYKELIRTIIEACHEHQADLILTGDIADRFSVTPDEISLLIELFTEIKNHQIKTILVSGNHEENGPHTSLYNYLRPDLISDGFIFGPKTYENIVTIYPGIIFTMRNHNDLKEEGVIESPRGPDHLSILLSHFRCTVGEYVKEEVPVNEICSKFDLVIASDIHSEWSDGNLHMTNAPLNSSFESNPKGSFLLLSVEPDSKEYSIRRVPTDLPQLIRKDCTASEFEGLIADLDPRHYYKICVSGTQKELRQIPNSFSFATIEKEAEIEQTFDIEVGREVEDRVDSDVEQGLIEYAAGMGIEGERLVKLAAILREA